YDFLETVLMGWLKGFNQRHRAGKEPMPWLAALVCCSAFDLAVHDAYGNLHGISTYETYSKEFMNRSLGHYFAPIPGGAISFQDKYPDAFLVRDRPASLVAWHLVAGLDPLEKSDL